MNRYRMDYVKLHDRKGVELKSKLAGSLKNEAPVLKNPVCYLAFWLRMQRDLKAYRLQSDSNNYDYAVRLLLKLDALHVETPIGLLSKLRFYAGFVRKALA